MIRLIELQEAARAWGLPMRIVEKDYVLGWLLLGLAADARIQTQWIFKGGTCLKKCYVETYRFSEDLDFTLTPQALHDPAEIAALIRSVCGRVGQLSGIDFPPDLIEFRTAPNPRGTVTMRGKIGYRGPTQPRTLPKIQIDLTTDEIIAQPPVLRSIFHPYSDRPATGPRIHCYPIDEMLAEKTRAMSERGRPRDLYDIIRLFRHEGPRLNATAIRDVLHRKCAHRGLPLPTYEMLAASPRRAELESEWGNMLAHQVPALPPPDVYWEQLADFFAWLNGQPIVELPRVTDVEPSDATWQPPESMVLPAAWGITAPIETIRFAGANRLMIDLTYLPEEGAAGLWRVEPYSFRRSQQGHLLFYGRNIQRPQISAYRFDRMVDVKVPHQPFVPQWLVEF